MAENIEREAAIEKLNKLCDRVCQYSKAQRKYMCGACPLGDAFTVIEDDIPAADVRPVVRGKWVQGDMPTYGGYKCSVCGANTVLYKANFCPNCGADMREEQDGR